MTGFPKKYGKAFLNLGMAVVIVLGCIFIVPKVVMLFMPFIIGWFLALLANPLVHFLEEKIKVKRKAGSAFVIISVIAGICFALYAILVKIFKEAAELGRVLPQMWRSAQVEFISIKEKWSSVIDTFPRDMVVKAEEIAQNVGKEMSTVVGRLSVPTADAVGNFAQNLPGVVIAVVMCLLSSYFFVAEKGYVTNLARKYFPSGWTKKLVILKKTTVDVIVGYLKAQLKIEIWIYLILVIGFMILKVRYAYLVALLVAFLDVLPVFGTGTILVPWAVFKLLNGQYTVAAGLLILWGIGTLVRQIIQPKMIGDSMGMEPLPTLILLYLGYKIAGVTGMIVAVPFGIFMVAMNEAGFFDNSKRSIRILWYGFQEFRQFTAEELQGISHRGEKDEEMETQEESKDKHNEER